MKLRVVIQVEGVEVWVYKVNSSYSVYTEEGIGLIVRPL